MASGGGSIMKNPAGYSIGDHKPLISSFILTSDGVFLNADLLPT